MTEAAPVVLLCSPDLMVAVRVEHAAAALGFRLLAAATPGEVRAAAVVRLAAVLVDLAAVGDDLAETVAAVRDAQPAAFVLGYFPHVQRELGAAGREAGCTLVVPRSRFMAELPALLRQAVAGQPSAASVQAGQE